MGVSVGEGVEDCVGAWIVAWCAAVLAAGWDGAICCWDGDCGCVLGVGCEEGEGKGEEYVFHGWRFGEGYVQGQFVFCGDIPSLIVYHFPSCVVESWPVAVIGTSSSPS